MQNVLLLHFLADTSQSESQAGITIEMHAYIIPTPGGVKWVYDRGHLKSFLFIRRVYYICLVNCHSLTSRVHIIMHSYWIVYTYIIYLKYHKSDGSAVCDMFMYWLYVQQIKH